MIKLKYDDFLEIRPASQMKLTIVPGEHPVLKDRNVCFISSVAWGTKEKLYIDYFMTNVMDSVKLVLEVKWAEQIDKDKFFCAGTITAMEEGKKYMFVENCKEV